MYQIYLRFFPTLHASHPPWNFENAPQIFGLYNMIFFFLFYKGKKLATIILVIVEPWLNCSFFCFYMIFTNLDTKILTKKPFHILEFEHPFIWFEPLLCLNSWEKMWYNIILTQEEFEACKMGVQILKIEYLKHLFSICILKSDV